MRVLELEAGQALADPEVEVVQRHRLDAHQHLAGPRLGDRPVFLDEHVGTAVLVERDDSHALWIARRAARGAAAIFPARVPVFFAFFVGSGFCGLLYEVVWTRLALASFGVTTTIVSVVLSAFMLGLALGSWLSGWPPLLRRLGTGRRFLRAYALVELGIGTGAFAVPFLFSVGRAVLLRAGATDSESYHLVSALLLGAALLPWATLIGATYALALGALRVAAGRSGGFSALYTANVLGAALGTVVTALVLIEILGFHGTLAVAAVVNAGIGVVAWVRSGGLDLRRVGPARRAGDGRGRRRWG